MYIRYFFQTGFAFVYVSTIKQNKYYTWHLKCLKRNIQFSLLGMNQEMEQLISLYTCFMRYATTTVYLK